jgi:hypothetical protein
MIGMALIIKPPTAACFQIVDPCEAVFFDKVVVEAETLNDQILWIPTHGFRELFQIAAQEVRDMEPARIVVATVEQDTALAGPLHGRESLHHGGTGVDVRPARNIVIGI